jgi:hypothetical protein
LFCQVSVDYMNSVFDRLGVDYLEQDRSEVGKLRFRGRSRTLGYFGIPSTSAEAFDVTEIVLMAIVETLTASVFLVSSVSFTSKIVFLVETLNWSKFGAYHYRKGVDRSDAVCVERGFDRRQLHAYALLIDNASERC